jgi:hypothetical protein
MFGCSSFDSDVAGVPTRPLGRSERNVGAGPALERTGNGVYVDIGERVR